MAAREARLRPGASLLRAETRAPRTRRSRSPWGRPARMESRADGGRLPPSLAPDYPRAAPRRDARSWPPRGGGLRGERRVGRRGAARRGAGAFGKIGGTDRRLALEIELVERNLDRARRRWRRRRSG